MTNSELYSEQTPEQPAKKAVPAKSAKEQTVLDQLTAAIKKKVERPTVHLEVPERPGVKLIISPNISQQQLRSWRRNAGEDTKNGLDSLKFACAAEGAALAILEAAGYSDTVDTVDPTKESSAN